MPKTEIAINETAENTFEIFDKIVHGDVWDKLYEGLKPARRFTILPEHAFRFKDGSDGVGYPGGLFHGTEEEALRFVLERPWLRKGGWLMERSFPGLFVKISHDLPYIAYYNLSGNAYEVAISIIKGELAGDKIL